MFNKQSEHQLKVLKRNARAGKISRRSFMEGALALGATIPAAASFWATDVRAATPKSGGQFRVGLDNGSTTDTLDPATYNSRFQIFMGHTRSNYLTEIGTDNQVMGELAEGFEASKDAKTWTLKLRKGVEFHNGKTFDANDAAASLNYHRNEGSKSAAKALLESVVDVKVDDAQTLVIQLSSGNADIPYALTDYHLIMLPADKEGKIDPLEKAGTGGYVLENFEPGVKANFKRFANYWKKDHAFFDEVVYSAINDTTARHNALLAAELDAIIECDYQTVDMLQQNPDLRIDEVPSGTLVGLPMHVDVAPFDNPDVRLALKYAIDREATIATVLNGHGSIGNDHPIAPIMPFYDASIEQRKYDPDKAKFHLKKAGLDSLKVSLSAANTVIGGAVDMALLYSEMAKKAGISIDVVREPDDGYWSNVWLKKPFCMSGWGQRPTADIIFTLGYAAGADWNESHFADEKFNQLLVEAKAELDNGKRGEMYAEMQRILHNDGGTIIPFFRNWLYARSSKVAHSGVLSGNWPLDGARGAERWWFA
jgi:peptide/nickel transport system substrate-binding protein